MSESIQKGQDFRTSQRFPVHLNVKVGHESGADHEECGTTGNMSAAGVYLVMEHSMPIGSTVDFEVIVPKDAVAADHDVHLACRGRVVRTEEMTEPHKTGVACVIDSYEIVRAADSAQED